LPACSCCSNRSPGAAGRSGGSPSASYLLRDEKTWSEGNGLLAVAVGAGGMGWKGRDGLLRLAGQASPSLSPGLALSVTGGLRSPPGRHRDHGIWAVGGHPGAALAPLPSKAGPRARFVYSVPRCT